MSKQEDFYEILRSKFIDRDIPVEEANWREMRKTIDASRKRNKRIVWTISSLATLALLVGSYALYTNLNNSKNSIVVNTKELPIANNNSTAINTSNNDAKKVGAPVNTKEAAITDNHSTVDNTPKANNNLASSNDNKAITQKPAFASISHKNNTSEVISPPTIASAPQKVIATVSSAEKSFAIDNSKAEKKDKTAQTSQPVASTNPSSTKSTGSDMQMKNDELNNALTPESPITSTSPVNNSSLANSNSSLGVTTTNNTTSKPIASTTETTTTSSNNTTPVQQTENQNTASNVESTSTTGAVSNTDMQTQSNSSNKTVTSAVSTTKTDTAAKLSAQSENKPVATSKSDSSVASTQQATALPPLEEQPPINNIAIVAGAGYSAGWSYGNTTQGNGITPVLGLEYSRTLSSKWSISAGITASTLTNIGSVPFTISHTTYDFGYHTQDTSITTKWLLYVTVPMQVEYKLGQKNTVGIGGTISYLVTGWGTVNVSNNSYSDVKGTSSTYTQYMNVEGFNRWNASIDLEYKRSITKRLSASLMPYFGLIDIKNNAFFKQNTFERDSGVKLLLSYSIL